MQVWLPDSERVRLAMAAEKTGCTKSQLAREAIVLMLDQMEDRVRERDALTKAGLEFADFTPVAKRTLGRAEDEAYKLGCNTISSAHLLLALCVDPIAGGILHRAGITYDTARRKMMIFEGYGTDRIFDQVKFSADAIQCLKRARRVAYEYVDPVVDSFHMLMAVVGQYNSGAHDVFEMAGTDREQLQSDARKLKPPIPDRRRRARKSE